MSVATTATPVLEIRGLTKFFGQLHAVRDVSLSVNPGEIYALIGPNGSGKTTLVKTVVGLLRPDAGTITIAGHSITSDPTVTKRHFGYVPDNPENYDFLSGLEFLELTAHLAGLPRETIDKRLKRLRTMFPHLHAVLSQRMEHYSRGNLQKTAFLAALLPQPPLLVIDEPVVGLDPDSIHVLGQELQRAARNQHAVFFVTHTIEFAQKFATHAGIMVQGQLVHETPVTPNTELIELYHRSLHHESP